MPAAGAITQAPTIFVVDDDWGLSRLVEKTLQREGFGTASAASFGEAVEWLGSHRPDLMLLDLKLQDTEGKELVDRLTAHGQSVPFVIITGQGDERVAVEMMKLGARDYLVKDVDFLLFVPEVVRRALGQIARDQKLALAEEALRQEHAFNSAVLDTSAALIVVLDRGGRIVRFNRACEQTTGYTFAEVKGELLWDLFIRADELAGVKQTFEELCSSVFSSQYENVWRTRDGQERLLAWSNSALLDRHGMLEYVIAVGIDITERRRLEEEILQISELEQRRLGQDLHDGLCQHLAATELMSQIVQQKLSKKSKADAARVADIGQHVRDAISQTRLLARGLSPVVLESEGLMAALQELSVSTETMFRVPCQFHCPLPVLVHDHGAATHLYRITQEAISNAIRHGRARRIDVTLERTEERLTLTVKDNGIGLPKDISSAKGMGLRIMRSRAAVIKAVLSVQNDPRGGAVVSCSIPNSNPVLDSTPHEHAEGTKETEVPSSHC